MFLCDQIMEIINIILKYVKLNFFLKNSVISIYQVVILCSPIKEDNNELNFYKEVNKINR
jgi:hypothetical protein